MKKAKAILDSSAESANKSQDLAVRLRRRIIDLARKAGKVGLTINQAEEQIDDHKVSSVSPRFSELVNRGALVRVVIGRDEPTKQFPNGAPRHFKRYDETTHRNVIVHWTPEFAPSPEENELSDKATLVAEDNRIQVEDAAHEEVTKIA